MSEEAYPLTWPAGWPRRTNRTWSKFGPKQQGAGMTQALDFLEDELRRLGARHPVISTNVRTRLDGRAYANQASPGDPAAAVYFTLNERRVVLACDKWLKVADNLYAIAKHIEALRGQERWGVGSIEQAFAGYVALQCRTQPSCWEVLGLDQDVVLKVPRAEAENMVMSMWRMKVSAAHPDRPGGSVDAFVSLNEAKDIALATINSN